MITNSNVVQSSFSTPVATKIWQGPQVLPTWLKIAYRVALISSCIFPIIFLFDFTIGNLYRFLFCQKPPPPKSDHTVLKKVLLTAATVFVIVGLSAFAWNYRDSLKRLFNDSYTFTLYFRFTQPHSKESSQSSLCYFIAVLLPSVLSLIGAWKCRFRIQRGALLLRDKLLKPPPLPMPSAPPLEEGGANILPHCPSSHSVPLAPLSALYSPLPYNPESSPANTSSADRPRAASFSGFPSEPYQPIYPILETDPPSYQEALNHPSTSSSQQQRESSQPGMTQQALFKRPVITPPSTPKEKQKK